MACFARWTKQIGSEVKQLACGQCIGCRLEYSRQWAIRCMHEAQLYEHNAYITLTVNEEHLELFPGGSLEYRPFQLFMKRLRKHFERNDPTSKEEPTKGTPLCTLSTTENRFLKIPQNRIRFYMSGEYGEQNARPHYHALLFNINFTDKIYLSKTPSGQKLYTSATLQKLWPYGFSSIGNVTFESAAYVARYVMKKITGQKQQKHYENINEHGEVQIKKTEFSNMSRRPGIGIPWITKYTADVYPAGEVVVNGKLVRPPKAYDQHYKIKNPKKYLQLIERRQAQALEKLEDNTNQRLEAKEAVKRAQLAQLKRKI